MTRYEKLLAEQAVVSSEIDVVNAELQARYDEMPPPPPTPVETPEDIASHLVTFRFLGLKTRKTRFLFVVDMNRYLGAHEPLVRKTVMRALDALHETYEFGIIGFQRSITVGQSTTNWSMRPPATSKKRNSSWPGSRDVTVVLPRCCTHCRPA
jgi:hypothetical protein